MSHFQYQRGPGRTWSPRRTGAGGLMSRVAELLIDCEEDRTLRAVLVGMLREGYRNV